MSGRDRSQLEKREYSHLPGNPTKLPDRLEMEIKGKMGTVKKQIMGTYGKAEFSRIERKFRKRTVEVSSLFNPSGIILQECFHGLPSDLSQMVHGGDAGPYKLVGILTGFLKNGSKDLVDSFPDPFLRKPVERIDRYDLPSFSGQSGVKAGGAIRTAQDLFFKIRLR
jgi:hypothetical protein